MDANVKLGNNLRYYRKQRDFTLKEMAEKIGMSFFRGKFVGNLQRKKSHTMKCDSLFKGDYIWSMKSTF